MTPSAREKMMDYLARRDHSEKELRTKLRNKEYSESEIESALEDGRQRGWIMDPVELAEKVSGRLSEKLRSHSFINSYLYGKGLPPVKMDFELEKSKALKCLKKKWPQGLERGFIPRQKALSFLSRRGFASTVCISAMETI